jgi:hypothetical protein
LRPDVLILATEWPERALVRAQLIEAGYEAVAIDAWPPPRVYRRADMKPRVMVIDLCGLPEPRATLAGVPLLLAPDRVLILTAVGTVAVDELFRDGFHVLRRPVTVGEIVAAVSRLLAAA